MERFRALAGLLLAVLVLGVLAPAAQAQTKITVGYGIASDFLAVLTARDEGIFAKHGLEVEMTAFTNGGLTPQALVSGAAQIAFNTGPVLVLSKDGGLDLVVFAGLSRIQKTNPHSALITRKGVTVTKPTDLIGKRIADPGINSSLDLVMKKWLVDGGVKLNQITVVELPFQLMGDNLKNGQIDAAFPVQPMLGRILESDAGTKSVDIQSAVNPDFAATFWSATREWASGASASDRRLPRLARRCAEIHRRASRRCEADRAKIFPLLRSLAAAAVARDQGLGFAILGRYLPAAQPDPSADRHGIDDPGRHADREVAAYERPRKSKRSNPVVTRLDCFASLAMTEELSLALRRDFAQERLYLHRQPWLALHAAHEFHEGGADRHAAIDRHHQERRGDLHRAIGGTIGGRDRRRLRRRVEHQHAVLTGIEFEDCGDSGVFAGSGADAMRDTVEQRAHLPGLPTPRG